MPHSSKDDGSGTAPVLREALSTSNPESVNSSLTSTTPIPKV